MHYNPTSSVLFITICSLNKSRYGELDYDDTNSISHVLSREISNRLFTRREEIRKIIVGDGSLSWASYNIKDSTYNDELLCGKDFNGGAEALYLPAIKRYAGRFYLSLGTDRATQLANSKHHLLILSGLYGVLRPFEPIQLYTCPLIPKISEIWNRDSLLTATINEYIKNNNIQYIFDLTSSDNYRGLIDWKSILPSTIRKYCGYDVVAPNERALVHFGEYCKELLQVPENKIKNLEVNTLYSGTIKFLSKSRPYSGLPKLRNKEIPKKRIRASSINNSKQIKDLISGNYLESFKNEEIPIGHWKISFSPNFIREFDNRIINNKELGSAVLHVLIDISKHPFQTSDDTIKKVNLGFFEYRLGKYRIIYEIIKDEKTVILNEFGTHNDSSPNLHIKRLK